MVEDEIFDSNFFSNNRKRLSKLVGEDMPIVLTANGLLQRNGDTIFPFRQDSSFWYLTGINEPDVTLVMDGPEEYLVVPTRNSSRQAFDGLIDTKQLQNISGIQNVLDDKVGWARLRGGLRQKNHVALLKMLAPYIAAHGLYTNPARSRLLRRIKAMNSKITVVDIRSKLTELRSIKQPSEIQAIQRAVDITTETLRKLAKGGWQSYKHEFEIEAAITNGFGKQNINHAYAPIIASGLNSCTLHYVRNDARLESGKLLLIDAGAEVSNYGADITRTYAFGVATKRQKEVHGAVLAVQNYAMSLLKPGVILKEYEAKVEQFMGKRLQELGLVKTTNRQNIQKFYPHATSHFLGLDVHDVGDYIQPLQAGMVLTVEPGIYIKDERIGIRIEDDVLITRSGIKVLSADLSRDLS